MNKDISKNESNNQLPSMTNEALLTQSPPQPENNTNKHLNQLRFSPLSPQPKFNEIIEAFELNAKNYPSKVNVCKGHSPNINNHHYSVHSNNSPIVQYYAGLTKSPIKDNLGRYSPEHQEYKEDKPFYQINYPQNQGPMTTNFNFSPSAIFNSSFQKKSSNSSIDVNNINSKPIPFMSKTLQEKIESHFINIEDNEHNPPNEHKETNLNDNVKVKHKGSISESDDEDDDNSSGENQDLYMLDFNSNEEEEDDDEEEEEKPSKVNTKINKKKKNIIDIDQSNNGHQNNNSNDNLNNNILVGSNIIFNNTKLNTTNNNAILPTNNTMVSNSTMSSNNLNSNPEKNLQMPIPLKGKNKFDEANLNYSHINNYQALNGGIPLNTSSEINNSTNANNAINLNGNMYYPQQIINFYPYSKPEMPQQQPYYNSQYYQNQKYMKENSTFTFLEDQSTLYGEKKNSKKIKKLDPQSYFNQPYEELAKNICNLAKDQGGCRYLQKILEEDPINATNFIYPSIISHLLKVINDPFGNYLIQKLFGTLNEAQINEIIRIISKNILDIGINSHGTRVIQQLINHLITPKLIESFSAIIKPFIVPLLNELNGTHIIQKFSNDYPAYGLSINLIIIDNYHALASHRHGCCVIQKYLETFDRDLHLKLLDKLISNCLTLVIDQFGNYVIQSIFYLGNINASNAIALKLLGNICFYSKHKYSSNVVEKCFDYCDDVTRLKLIEVLSMPDAVIDLILDEHGNYVIQKVIACSHFKIQSTILQYIVPLFNKLLLLPFGEHIISRLLVSYPQLNSKTTEIDMKKFKGGKQGVGINTNSKYNNNNIRDNDNSNSNYQGKGNNNKNYNKNNYKGYNKNAFDNNIQNLKGKPQNYK